jgi:hypothetical protein
MQGRTGDLCTAGGLGFGCFDGHGYRVSGVGIHHKLHPEEHLMELEQGCILFYTTRYAVLGAGVAIWAGLSREPQLVVSRRTRV